jgi:hypothetical protein
LNLHTYFILFLAVLTFIVLPIALVWTFVRGMRTKASDREGGGGGMSNAVTGAMLELDRLFTRPSIEHTIETEHPTLKREDDSGGKPEKVPARKGSKPEKVPRSDLIP